jgi:hypothetical protein
VVTVYLLERLRGFRRVRSDVDVPDPAEPVPPCDVAILDVEGLVHAVIPKAREEDSTAQKRDLKGLEVDIYAVSTPGVGANSVCDEPGEHAVEVEEEEYAQCGSKQQEDEKDPAVRWVEG